MSLVSLLVLLLIGFAWLGFRSDDGRSNQRAIEPSTAAATAMAEPNIAPTSSVPAPAPPTTPPSPSEPPAVEKVVDSSWRVPILMYHYVRTVDPAQDQLGFNLSVTPEQLAEELDYLIANGYQTIDPAQLIRGESLPEKPILLTFDDGYADFGATAWPLIRDHGLTATLFVVTGFLGRDGYLSADQVKQLTTEGVTIGAHSTHHVNLAAAAPETLAAELSEPKATLEALVGKSVPWLAYPSGRYSEAVLAASREAGYRFGVTTNPGVATSDDEPLALPRIRISGGDSIEAFAGKLGQ